MQITTLHDTPHTAKHDVVVLGVFADDISTPDVRAIDAQLGGALKQACKEQDFSGKAKQQIVLNTLGKIPAKRVALVGLGADNGVQPSAWLRFAGTATRIGNSTGAKSLLLVPPARGKDAQALVALLARGLKLGAYRYDRLKSDKGRAPTVHKAVVCVADPAASKAALQQAQVVAESVALARDLVNQPANELFPETFAAHASKIAKAAGLTVKVLGPAELKKRHMHLLLGVGQGSERTPRLVHISYTPKGKKSAQKPVALIGKGITFDSGGLSLKPPDGMITMKMDMGGAAAVLATLVAVAKLKLPVAVHGIMALAENMPSGTAIRPGDVITGAGCKSVEIVNTDAEGRLVLADALHYAGELEPQCMVDLATLTGACMVALGPNTTGLMCNRDGLARGLLDAAKRAGEDTWRMPLTASLRDQLKSDVADMKNTGDRYGGAITAALFLKEFVGETPWAHMDIAGPAFSSEDGGVMTKGGTGVGVATLIDFLSTEVGTDRVFD